MKILVINCGSSSLKYQVIDMNDEHMMCKGTIERIGVEGSNLVHKKDGQAFRVEKELKNHLDAINLMIETITSEKVGVVKDIHEIDACGHRVVHAGEKYNGSVTITDDVVDALIECSDLAPLHNPANILGIKACEELMGDIPQVGVFDSAFHQTIPKEVYMYALPYEYYEKYGVRRYGFHGISYSYVSKRACEILGKKPEDTNLVMSHLGGGSTACAFMKGKSYDTSTGFTPLEGVMMGTRTGDFDPSIVTYIMEKEGLSIDEMNKVLNKQSGLLGISGVSGDFRDLDKASAEGNERAKLAIDMFCYRVKSYIGRYLAEINGADAIVFTGGIGENRPDVRRRVCQGLSNLGVKIDLEKNQVMGKEMIISTDDSPIKIMVIPTNEELMIARETLMTIKER
ncbi:MAG: acetate kinase [Clostridia bacterium]|nr:acetate kinase [Clostridia bacterium]